jgi:aspartate aminotransferase
MIKIASRIDRVKPSPTLATTARAKELKAQGRTIIPLSAGEPDFDTPEFIKAAAKQALDAGKTKYTPVPGTPELKAAIVAKIKRDYDLEVTAEQILVSNGGKHAIYNALAATVEQDDEVIIPAPYWVSYPDMVKVCDGTPVIVDCGAEQEFKMSASQLEQAITPKTKWLMLNSPSNPTPTEPSSFW